MQNALWPLVCNTAGLLQHDPVLLFRSWCCRAAQDFPLGGVPFAVADPMLGGAAAAVQSSRSGFTRGGARGGRRHIRRVGVGRRDLLAVDLCLAGSAGAAEVVGVATLIHMVAFVTRGKRVLRFACIALWVCHGEILSQRHL